MLNQNWEEFDFTKICQLFLLIKILKLIKRNTLYLT